MSLWPVVASIGSATKCHSVSTANSATAMRSRRGSDRNSASSGRHSITAACDGMVSDCGSPRNAESDCDHSTAAASASAAANKPRCSAQIARHAARWNTITNAPPATASTVSATSGGLTTEPVKVKPKNAATHSAGKTRANDVAAFAGGGEFHRGQNLPWRPSPPAKRTAPSRPSPMRCLLRSHSPCSACASGLPHCS